MGLFTWLVFTNCAEGKDDEFNRWYDEVHVPDLMRIPGMISARRSRIADVQMLTADNKFTVIEGAGADHRYLAVYKFETEDPSEVLREIAARAGTEDMTVSDSLTEARALLFQDF